MKTTKVLQLQKKIQDLEDQKVFFNSAITLIMDEQNLMDLEIEEYIRRGQKADTQLRDLRAELADTI